MKKILTGLCLMLTNFLTHAQTQGLENIIVEKYYISNVADSIGASGLGDDLPVGSVTYRIFADMLPGYKFQAAYGTQDNTGTPLHTLVLTTSTSFYNNTDRGHEIPSYSKSIAAQKTTMIDSWFSAGAACTSNYGILKTDDGSAGGTNVVNANGLLQNNDPAAGIPLTTADGIYLAAPAPSAVTFVNLAQAQSDFDGGPSSNGLITSNGSWASLAGATGPTSANRVLIGQFTTNGCFQFELNIQIGTPTGGFQNYVAKNPTGNEIMLPSLTYPLVASNTVTANISAVPSGPICSGTSVTFTATPLNGGTNPVYQWKKNGLNVGTGGPTYTDNLLNNNDQISCEINSNQPCVYGNPAVSNVVNITVNAFVSASVNISANPSGSICSGTNVTFTAAETNGGTNPVYQWLKNGLNVGTGGTTYTDNILNNTDQVSCIMTSSLLCVNNNPDTSNVINMTVNLNVTPSVNISANPAGPICSGTNVTFTAAETNGGTNPVYQWLKNGLNVGTGGSTYSDNTLNNNDLISCEITSTLPCVSSNPVTSNVINTTVSTSVTPAVSISANPSGAICQGTSVTFTAAETNGGNTPIYQWIKNGVNVGSGGNSYSDSLLNNNDQVSCVMTSDLPCVSGNPATSNIITLNVGSSVASVTITSNITGTICGGTVVKYTAIPVNGGASPIYQWKKNGNNVGTNSPNFSNTSNLNNFSVVCMMTSNASCVTGNPATSNTITINVNPSPSVTITATGPTTFCAGANPLILTGNTATGISYQWRKSGANIIGASGFTYAPSASATYKVVVTNLAGCTGISNGIPVTVNPLPVSTITASGPLTFCNGDSVVLQANSGAGLNYQWVNTNNIFINGATSQNYSAKTQGYYKVIVTNSSNGCGKYSGSKHVIVNCRNTSSILEVTVNHLTIYPNPTEGPFNIILTVSDKESGKAQVEILNLLGQNIYTGNSELSNGELNIQVNSGSEFRRGLYFVKVTLNGVSYDSKLILQ